MDPVSRKQRCREYRYDIFPGLLSIFISYPDGYDYDQLREFLTLFPFHPLTSLLKGYFVYMQIPVSDDAEDGDCVVDPDVGYDAILVNTSTHLEAIFINQSVHKEAYPSISTSLIATRIVAEVHLLESDYENAIQSAESGLQALTQYSQQNGRKLPKYVCQCLCCIGKHFKVHPAFGLGCRQYLGHLLYIFILQSIIVKRSTSSMTFLPSRQKTSPGSWQKGTSWKLVRNGRRLLNTLAKCMRY